MEGSSFSSSCQDLIDLLECPVCLESMYPPIYQCPNGHTLCSKCKPDVRNKCPTCRVELGDIRALTLEKIGASLRLPCKYSRKGCTQAFRLDLKQRHEEEECDYRPYKCPFPCSPCLLTGDVDTLVTHLAFDHQSELNDGNEIDSMFQHLDPYNDQNTSLNVAVYRCYFQNFCLHFEAFHSPVDMVYLAFLMFMGDEIGALDYRYSLEIGNGLHKLTWQGIPRSIREGVDQIRESYDGLVIHRSVAQRFADVNNMEMLMLRVKGLIWKEA